MTSTEEKFDLAVKNIEKWQEGDHKDFKNESQRKRAKRNRRPRNNQPGRGESASNLMGAESSPEPQQREKMMKTRKILTLLLAEN